AHRAGARARRGPAHRRVRDGLHRPRRRRRDPCDDLPRRSAPAPAERPRDRGAGGAPPFADLRDRALLPAPTRGTAPRRPEPAPAERPRDPDAGQAPLFADLRDRALLPAAPRGRAPRRPERPPRRRLEPGALPDLLSARGLPPPTPLPRAGGGALAHSCSDRARPPSPASEAVAFRCGHDNPRAEGLPPPLQRARAGVGGLEPPVFTAPLPPTPSRRAGGGALARLS